LGRLGIDLGLVLPCPDNLRSRETGQRGIKSQIQEPLSPDRVHDPLALGGRALVVPHDTAPEDAPLGVQHDHAVHLSGQAKAGDIAGAYMRGIDDLPYRLDGCLPPILGVLLRPLRPRGIHGIVVGGAADQVPQFIDQEGAGSRSAYVDS